MSVVIPGIADAAKLIAAKKLSPVELTLAAMDGVLNAFILLTSRMGDGRREGAVGPMHGIPIGLKDIVDTAGIATTCQSRLLADNGPGTDAFEKATDFRAMRPSMVW